MYLDELIINEIMLNETSDVNNDKVMGLSYEINDLMSYFSWLNPCSFYNLTSSSPLGRNCNTNNKIKC